MAGRESYSRIDVVRMPGGCDASSVVIAMVAVGLVALIVAAAAASLAAVAAEAVSSVMVTPLEVATIAAVSGKHVAPVVIPVGNVAQGASAKDVSSIRGTLSRLSRHGRRCLHGTLIRPPRNSRR
jgi:hypothetical protein